MRPLFNSPSGGCVMQALRNSDTSSLQPQADLPPLALYGAQRQPWLTARHQPHVAMLLNLLERLKERNPVPLLM